MQYELSHRERVSILCKRLVNLRFGKGEYTPAEREKEIAGTQDALQQAYADRRREWISAQ